MKIRGVAAAWLLLVVALTACGTPDSRAAACDPDDALHQAILADPALARAETRDGLSRDGLRSSYDVKAQRCTPVSVTRQWTLGEDAPQARLIRLTAELQQDGWTPRPETSRSAQPCPDDAQPECARPGAFALTRGFDKQVGGRVTSLSVFYKAGHPALLGRVDVDMAGG